MYIPPYFVVGWTVNVNQNRYTKCYINTYPFGDLGEVGSESSGGPLRKNEKSKGLFWIHTARAGRAAAEIPARNMKEEEKKGQLGPRDPITVKYFISRHQSVKDTQRPPLDIPSLFLFLTVMGLDTLDPPRRRDLSFFLVALFVVAPLRLVAPLSWIFVVYSLYTGFIWSFTWRGNLFFAFALCEVCIPLYFDVSEASITTQTTCNHLGGLSSAVMLLGGYNQSVWLCWLPTTSQHR